MYGCDGLHHTSLDRLLPRSPTASMLLGNSRALPTVAILGRKSCWPAWFQNVVKSGGIGTPMRISAPASLNCEIWAEKSWVPLE